MLGKKVVSCALSLALSMFSASASDGPVADPKPFRAFATSGTFFRLNGEAWELPIESVNADSLEVEVSRIYPNRLAAYALVESCFSDGGRYWFGWRTEGDYLCPMGTRKVALPSVRNRTNPSSLSLDALGIERKPGAYLLEAGRAGRRVVVVTDLALTVMRGERDYLVGVRSITGNGPVAGADVQLVSRKLQVLAEAETDADGFARLSFGPLEDPTDGDAGVFVRLGEDASFVSVDGLRCGLRREDSFAEVIPRDRKMGAFLFADRGICRPGESIGLSACLREAGTLRALGGVPLELVVRDPRGKVVSCVALTGSEAGFYHREVAIPSGAATGSYSYALRLPGGGRGAWSSGAGSFLVGEYVPDRVRLATSFASDAVAPGEALHVTGRADYTFGASVPRGDYKIDVRERVVPFAPADWRAFSFGARGVPPADRSFKASGRFGPDAGGRFEAAIDAGRRTDEPTLPVEFRAVTTLTPGTGRAVSSTATALCHYRDFYVGVRDDGAHGENRRLALVGLTPGEEVRALAGTGLRYALTRKTWEYRLARRDGRTAYDWQEAREEYPSAPLELKPAADGSGVCEAEVPVPGSGSFEIAVLDAGGRALATLPFWHLAGESGERSRNPSVMRFDLDRESYAPGSVANVSFDVFAPGEVLVMAGGCGLDAVFSRRATVGRNTIPVPVPAACAEGSYFAGVTVVADDARASRAPKRTAGIVRIPVDQTARKLLVKLETPEVARPRGTAAVRLTVTDAEGNPAAAEARVWAVDRGILSLTAWETPDVWGRFFGTANCPFRLGDTYADFYPDLRVVDGKIGGGDALAGFLAKDKSVLKAPAILKQVAVSVPATGVAEVVFDNLPDFSGALLVSAVVADADRLGSGSAELVMRDAVSVEMDAPLFASPGDCFDVGLTCFNHEADGEEGTWRVTAKGLDVRDGFPARGAFALAKGASARVSVPVAVREDAVALPAAELEAVLRVGSVAVTNTVSLAARPARAVTARMTNVWVKAGERVAFSEADSGMASYVSGDLWTGSPSLAALGAVAALDDYPCRCAEQTAARAFPSLALRDLAAADERILEARAGLAAMRLADGYYSMWPGVSARWEEASLFVWHFLLEADARGFALDAEERAVIAARLRRYVNDRDNLLPDRAYAAYVLSLADAPSAASAARGVLAEAGSDAFSRLLAGAALMKADHAREGAEVVRAAREETFYAGSGGGLDTEARRLGLALWILGDLLPDDATSARLSDALLRLRYADGAWGSTQNNAWAALGLSRAAGTVRSDAKPVHRKLARGFSVEVENPGAAPLFVTLRHLGVPEAGEDAARGFSVTRAYRRPGDGEDAESLLSCGAGDLLEVRLEVESGVDCENVVLTDMLPGGFDIEDERLATRGFNLPRAAAARGNCFDVRRIERRGDRFIAIGNIRKGKGFVTYPIRAVTPGTYALGDVTLDAMYRPDLKGAASGKGTFEVKPSARE